MEQHNDEWRISHQPSKRIGAIDGRLPHIGLCKKLFPAIGEWHDRLASKELGPGDPIQLTVAENAFVHVIMMFRKTFIQDSVLPMELRPCYPDWQRSIFSDPAYLSSKRDILQIEAQEHDPAHTLLQQRVPMHSRFQTPIGHKIIVLPVLLFYSFFPSSLLFCLQCHSLYSTTTNERTNERVNERTNDRLRR
ncbi:hypothetical protein [Absidia glauca]|uniref:Ndc10 domain-containing protein n=1 Tax=Absidia glauca TaxID=4829 RepID=A0A163JRZ9_ABSGL|nr:hypothetical protein [Absidia glauca]